ncbi:MAG: NHLP bacteriocin export ABC transporter permease/ATPase subunit [Negativicutes bacterium]|jgi:ATP-binding cassette subfamily C protein
MKQTGLRDWEIRQQADDNILSQAMDGLLGRAEVPARLNAAPEGQITQVLKKLVGCIGMNPEAVKEPEHFYGINWESFSFASMLTYVTQVCESSHIGMRSVALKADWYKLNSGPLLAFLADGAPCALIPSGDQAYQAHFVDTPESKTVDADFARELYPKAVTIYRLFPKKQLKIRDILEFSAIFYTWKNALTFGAAILISAGLSSVTPVISGKIFGDIVPASDAPLLIVVGCTLFLLALGGAYTGIVKGFAMSNIEINIDMSIHAAVIERLFSMPESFFKKMTTGDILSRLNDINTIRSTLANTAIGIATALFTVFLNGYLMFVYGGSLAWIVVVSTLLYSGLLALISWRQMYFYKQHLALGSDLSSKVLQIIGGIAKLKVLRAEKRAFAMWAEVLARQLNVDRRETNWGTWAGTILTAVQVSSSVLIYWFISERVGGKEALPFSAFIAFIAAYGIFSASFTSIVGSLSGLLHIVPVYKRITPLLETLPETTGGGKNIDLRGGLKVDNVSFAYEDGKNVLEDFSLEVTPGEFVAIVGSSGCGKTTLLRLLLGFVKPSGGALFYDTSELSTLDLRSVRRQCGTVLQTGQLLPGSIFQNIVGVYNYSVDDAWTAAEAAGIAEDIRKMPMKMHTMIPEGAATISGGQRQRLLIARALIKKPHYVFFDEATSALDNISQAVVMHSLERLAATRIVIAHRLSTVKNADRIIVLEKGRIAESGTYHELMAQNGLFAKFAASQEN